MNTSFPELKLDRNAHDRMSLNRGRGRKRFTTAAMVMGFAAFALAPVGSAHAEAARDGSALVAPFLGAPLSFADLARKVKPAVVSISVKGDVKTVSRELPGGRDAFPGLPKDSPFREFFKKFNQDPRANPNLRRRPTQSQGSGFIISADGYVVTNNHVIDDAKKITVTMDDRTKVTAKVIGTDPRTDIALLKMEGKRSYPFVKFAKKPAQVGEWVLAVGNPFGLGGTVTAGIVSARGRDIGSGPYDYLQIDAAVNRGNSGGPAFNLSGDVVGVNTAIFSPSGGNVGIAFAVPAAIVTDVVSELKSRGSVSRGWLGVHIQNVTDDIAASMGMDDAHGALVTKVMPDGPAARDGIQVGDTIIAVNNLKIEDSRDLARKIAGLDPKTSAKIKVFRQGREKVVSVRLGLFPDNKKLAKLDRTDPKPSVPEKVKSLGMSLTSAALAGGKEQTGALITEIESGSEAANKGIQQGDVIVEVAGIAVNTPSDVERGVKKAKKLGRKAVLLRIKSGERQRYLALPLKKG